MSNKNAIAKLYEYCQNKNTTISISDLDFIYEINPNGFFNCKVKLNGEIFEKNLSCKSKRAAKNEIAAYVYEELMKRDIKGGYLKEVEDNRNAIAKLNEYFQDKNTKLNLSDLNFEFGITPEGYFNCIVTIGDKKYDKHLKCKSKKEAKNEIAEYVYNSLIVENENKSILNEKVKELLIENKISLNEINIYDQKVEKDKYMYIFQWERFKKYNDEGKILFLEPSSKDDLNNKIKKLIEKDLINKKEMKKEKRDNYSLKEYIELNKIPYRFEYEFNKCKFPEYKSHDINKKLYEVKYTCSSLGIVIGKNVITIEDRKDEEKAKKKVKKQAEEEALNVLKNFVNDKKSIFPPYVNNIELNLDNEILTNLLTEDDTKSNIYIQNITQNFISSSSKKAEKKNLNDINTIITEIMNKIKKENKISGSYLIKKINNYEVWNLINYEIILYVEFKIDFIKICLSEISKKIKEKFEDSILEFDEKEEVVNKNEKTIRDPYRIRVRLNNGCTFCIYVGNNVYEEMLTKYVSPFKSCLDIERKFIQFAILWSNLILYQDFKKEPKEGFCYYLKEQERIFTTLALYAWDYTSKNLRKSDNKKKKHCYILSFTNLIYMLANYEKLNVVWYDIKERDRKLPLLMDPISNDNLITSRNKFIWKAYKKYANTIYVKEEKKIKLFLDEEDETNNKYKVLFNPQVCTDSFTKIKSVYFVVKEDPKITVKSSMYHIPKESTINKDFLNVVFNSLQSYLLLNLYNTENAIQIQNYNNEKNDKKFEELNNDLKEELENRIETFFKFLNKDIKVNKNKKGSKENEINKLFFILGNNVNVSIEITIKIRNH